MYLYIMSTLVSSLLKFRRVSREVAQQGKTLAAVSPNNYMGQR